MGLTFYTNPMSRGQIVRWMLEEVGEPYETIVVDYREMSGEAYRTINPMMKVPALIHDGRTVTECAAIIAYLADVCSTADLGPRPEEKADYYRWLFFAAGPLEQALTAKTLGFEPNAEQSRSVGFGNVDRTLDALAGHLSDRPFVCGQRFTAADVYVGSHVLWGTQFGTIPGRDAFAGYIERLSARDAYVRGKAIDNRLIAEAHAAAGAEA